MYACMSVGKMLCMSKVELTKFSKSDKNVLVTITPENVQHTRAQQHSEEKSFQGAMQGLLASIFTFSRFP